MNNYAYISVLSTDSYLTGILGLAKCLKKVNSKYPLYVVITNNLSLETLSLLDSNSINTIKVTSIQIPQIIKEKNSKGVFSHWTYTFDKLSIFELTQFKKIVYLDSDIYIRKNIDLLFDNAHMSTTPNRKFGPNVSNPPELISGLLVIEPKAGLLDSFMKILKTIADKRESIGDQDILQEYYTDWKDQINLHLDLKYNAFFTYLDYYTSYCNYDLDDIYVFHFLLAKKPWHYSKNEIDDYLQYLNNRVNYLYELYKTKDLANCINSGNDSKRKIIEEYFDIIDEYKKGDE